MPIIRSAPSLHAAIDALDLSDVNPDRCLCLPKAREALSWYAPTRADWLAVLLVEQFQVRPRVRSEAKKMGLGKVRWG